MNNMIDIISEKFMKAFEEAGYDSKLGKVVISNRPDLCQYQCNGAMAGAKMYKKAPFMIADEVVEKVANDEDFASVESVKPGFININVSDKFLANYVNEMKVADKFGFEAGENQTVMVDYGGANVAKPLHVGHLRPAVIGEAIKRIKLFAGNKVIGDVHLGDWGLQMGLIITELKERKPDLVYFDENYEGEYPTEAPFTISELEEIYPTASAKSKEDEAYLEKAHDATLKLQQKYPPYMAIFNHIMNVSVEDLKKNYGNLNVTFDLWKGESDAEPYIPGLIQDLVDKGLAYESEGALVVDIAKEDDKKEYPPCIVRKSDGASLYATSDLGTIVEREKDYNPDQYIYVADKRQSLHFLQVFRVAKKAGIVSEDTKLDYLGFGTVNGLDGKPFKTRDGGTMKLSVLIKEIEDAVYEKMKQTRDISEEELRSTSKIVGLAALKYGDLSNQIGKDYIFDIDKFASFEGNTGPYILYTIVRIKSILEKFKNDFDGNIDSLDIVATPEGEQNNLMLQITKFSDVIKSVCEDLEPHKLCTYIYELSNEFNRFYHGTKILGEEDETKKNSYIALINLVKNVLETSIDILGFSAPDRM